MEQRSTEWFEARKGRITASSVGAILGLSPHMNRDGVMRRMVREYHGAEQEFTGNVATEYGTYHETGAMAEFTMETGMYPEAVGFIPFEDWAGCSPDGLIGDECGLEIKCPFGKRKDEAPAFLSLAEQPHYEAQVQFSMAVTGRKRWLFYQWAPSGTKLEVIEASAEWQAENMPKLRQFYAEYLDEIRTPEQHLEAKRVVVDTPAAQKLAAEFDDLSDAIELAEARKKEVLAEMVALAGDRDAIVAGRNLTKVSKAGAISYAKAIKELLPKADLEKWRGKPSSYWVLK